jgi:hypothetical protein
MGRRPSADDRGPGPERVVLSRDGESVVSAELRGDLFAVRGMAEEEMRAVLDLYRMDLVDDGAEASANTWTLARLPEMASTPASVRWLALMLEGEGVEVAAVAELADGSLVAVLPEVDVAVLPGVPETWIERLMPTLVPEGSWGWSDASALRIDLRPLFGTEVHQLVRILAARREFASVRCRLERIGEVVGDDPGQDTPDIGEVGTVVEEGVIQEVQR